MDNQEIMEAIEESIENLYENGVPIKIQDLAIKFKIEDALVEKLFNEAAINYARNQIIVQERWFENSVNKYSAGEKFSRDELEIFRLECLITTTRNELILLSIPDSQERRKMMKVLKSFRKFFGYKEANYKDFLRMSMN